MGKRQVWSLWSSTLPPSLGIDDISYIRIGQLLSPARAGMAPSAHTFNKTAFSSLGKHDVFTCSFLHNKLKMAEQKETPVSSDAIFTK